MKGKRQLNITLTDEEYAELERRAKATGKTYRQLICEDMELGHEIALSPHGDKGLVGIKDEDISEAIKRVVRANTSWIGGYDFKGALKDVAEKTKWGDLSDADRLYLLMHLKHEWGDNPHELEKNFKRAGEIFKVDPREVEVFYDRIVETVPRKSYDVRAEA